MISKVSMGPCRDELVKKLNEVSKKLLSTPNTEQALKKLVFCCYADDWILGVKGSKQEYRQLKQEISDFLKQELKLELSESKTLITHSSKKVRFLGYDISIRRCQQVRVYRKKSGVKIKQRTLNYSVNLEVPLTDKIMKFLFSKGAIIQLPDGGIRPRHRKELVGKPDQEIVNTYNSEAKGILNFYGIASNYYKLSHFCYPIEYSCLFALIFKHKFTCSKAKLKYHDEKNWYIPVPTKKDKNKRIGFVDFKTYKPPKEPEDVIKTYEFHGWKTTIWQRLKAGI